MERFNSIYPFTTENISGYMSVLDLNNKRVICVTGSSDHILNVVLLGCKNILTFDVNQLTKYYMDLKISAIKKLSYKEFLEIFLYESDKSLDYEVISKLAMNKESYDFWMNEYKKNNYDGLLLRKSGLFNLKYFNPESKIKQNLYLEENKYNDLKKKLESVTIEFINVSLKDLVITQNYDYMFLSNIGDYLNLMFESNLLNNYFELISKFKKYVNNIYFAYLYNINNKKPRSDIDNINKVINVFGNIRIQEFPTALEINEKNIKDGVLIIEGK